MNSKIAKKFIEYGLSVVAVDSKKLPIGAWKQFQSRLPFDYELSSFDDPRCTGIAIVGGAVSGGLEIIDIDSKYDITLTLFERYMEELPISLQEKLVVATTANNGYHLIYRAPNIEGNQKLAQRHATEQELLEHPGSRIRVLLETRGTGGYFLTAPSAGYKMLKGKLSDIPVLSEEERNILIETARSFNEVQQEMYTPREAVAISSGYQISPFDDFNNKVDVVALLESHGWTTTKVTGQKFYLKRPGTENKWSAEYDRDKNWFTVFSSSTEFEPLKAYKPYAIYATLNGINDWKELASRLSSEGYGTKIEKQEKPISKLFENPTVDISDVSDDFIGNLAIDRDKLEDYIAGRLNMGLDTGYSHFDNNFRFKRGNLVIINGFDNVGKTTMILWMAMISSVRHRWKWLLYCAENSNVSVLRDLITFYCCKPLRETTFEERNAAMTFINSHFMLMSPNDMMDYELFKKRYTKVFSEWQFDAMLVDPYNALDDSKSSNSHQFNYSVLTDIKIWGRVNDVSVWINMHANTAASRISDADGYTQMPNKYSTEGGVKAANKADEFLTFHRITNHEDPELRRTTMISVEKIKETLTGGTPTIKGKPLMMQMLPGMHEFRLMDQLEVHPFKKILNSIDLEEVANDEPPF